LRAIERRLNDLERRAGYAAGAHQATLIVRRIVAPGDEKHGRPAWLHSMSILGAMGTMRFVRGADEDKRAFLARAGEGYRAVHGPLPDDWFCNDAARPGKK